MEIRDVIHGSIEVDSAELPIIDSRFFQRLRQIKQLGFAENSFPSATHNRYIHSIGAMHTATRAFDTIFARGQLSPADFTRLRAVVRLGALLHDVGHGPLSHTSEFAMPSVKKLGLAGIVSDVGSHGEVAAAGATPGDRKATHEDYTLKIILDSSLTPLIEKAGAAHGFGPKHVASLIDPTVKPGDDFFKATFGRGGELGTVDVQPVLKQLISSELDADRMDYLRRDSMHAGVSYGQFDFDWVVGNLTTHVHAKKAFLALQHRALYSFEDFLISRFHMFLMVYFHYKSVVFDEMLGQYLAGPDGDYVLPSDIEKYIEYNDAHLYAHLARSKNEWAKRISDRRPYRMLVELHSGIPAKKNAAAAQEKLLTDIKADLDSRGIHYLTTTTTGELSKYFRKVGESSADPIFVRYDNGYSQTSHIRLEECTDLFQRYSEKRSIMRLYVSPENYPLCRHQGRGSPLAYQDEASDIVGGAPA